jgi:hypothetical protein
MTDSSPAGNFDRSLTAAGMSPVSSSALSFSSRVLPIQLGHPSLARERHDGDRRVADRLGRRVVGDDAVGDRAVELVEVAELVERGGDLGVGQVGHGGCRLRGRS